MFNIVYDDTAEAQLKELSSRKDLVRRFKAVTKALILLSQNPRHPSLHTHEFDEYSRALGVKVYEAYAENATPRAYRIFFFYGEDKNTIKIFRIEPHS